ncbi:MULTISPECIES: type I restriction-modification system subunit M [Porphyromonas]|uniref:site-specific DNA-methyltransferase (adenine-specific) n=1 Tax=Porphyromonas canoris TaxID=36875 RepID=A0ABR4XKY6_9PORP|nr:MULTISPECIES: type I restriction-modification system subunit M [Porphyromonas]KGN67364.1 restriction endonuclease subunit M [Porphyromonas sp. COT-108 OH1349]KGN92100.1 restriction endonuclease subunit M [Porphyromonas canoris]
MSEEQKRILKAQLWAMANDMRGSMDAAQFMNYSLGLIFYKYLSERIELFLAGELSEDNITFAEAWNSNQEDLKAGLKEEAITQIGYFIEPQFLFSSIAERAGRGEFIIEDLGRAFDHIEDSTLGAESKDDFQNLFDDVDLTSQNLGKTVDEKNRLISKLLLALRDIDFRIEDAEIDVLGDAYEYMIGEFAAGAGKKAGEFYTPQEVSNILAQIVTVHSPHLKHVYDPTCGSGSLLLQVAKLAGIGDVRIYGQEKNPKTYNLARMNMLLHNVRFNRFSIMQGDTLEDDLFGEEQFDAIVANPPFSAKWSADSLFLKDERFNKAGKLAPSSKADYAFILHMLHHLNDGGTMACVAPHGVLFRGAAEGVIRKYLIETRNWIDAVIGLPANLFYGTGIPTCILVMRKCRQENDAILFIDASREFDKVKAQNKLAPEHIAKIVETYRTRTEIERYSHAVTLDEIRANDYNLNIPRYVDTFEEEEEIDIQAVMSEIKTLEARRAELDSQINVYLRELGLIQ